MSTPIQIRATSEGFQTASEVMVGHLRERLIGSARRNQTSYGLFTWQEDLPLRGFKFRFMEFFRFARDDIPDALIQWVQSPFSGGGLQDVQDRLIAQNTAINTSYLDFAIHRLRPLKVSGKVKWDHYFQRGNQSRENRDESFLGAILRAEYFYEPFAGITISPKWKQQYARQVPTDLLALQRNELSEIFFLIGTYDLIPGQLVSESGIEWEVFRNLRQEPDPLPPAFVEDFTTLTLATQFTNRSDYQGYALSTKIGVRWQRRALQQGDETNFLTFVTIFAGLR